MPWSDLDWVFRPERAPRLQPHRFDTRRQPGHRGCGFVNQIFRADEPAVIPGELAIQALDMPGQEALAGLAFFARDHLGSRRLVRITRRSGGEHRAQIGAGAPVCRECRDVPLEIAPERRAGFEKGIHGFDREAGTQQRRDARAGRRKRFGRITHRLSFFCSAIGSDRNRIALLEL
jgi:hypothetical protein